MGCLDLYLGQDLRCKTFAKKYYQQVVLINKEDVLNFNIQRTTEKHRIEFQLKDGKTGYLYAGNENASVYNASFSKDSSEGVNEYSHQLELPIMGVSEETKLILKQLDSGEYFGAIQWMDGTVEIYGWEYGLKTNDYNYAPQGSGGSVITLSSDINEDEPPYIYYSDDPNSDFNNLFSDNSEVVGASFNNDFNNDFDILIP